MKRMTNQEIEQNGCLFTKICIKAYTNRCNQGQWQSYLTKLIGRQYDLNRVEELEQRVFYTLINGQVLGDEIMALSQASWVNLYPQRSIKQAYSVLACKRFRLMNSSSDQYCNQIRFCGRLDLMSQGLLLLTNDGDLAQALEHPSNEIQRSYRVRVFGRMFNEQKLRKIRQGMMIKGVYHGPYICTVEKRQSTNTWLHIKLKQGKYRQIRNVMRSLSLRVNRLQRVQYGSYKINQVPLPNDLREIPLNKQTGLTLKQYYQNKMKSAQNRIFQVKNQLVKIRADEKGMNIEARGKQQSSNLIEGNNIGSVLDQVGLENIK